MLDPLLKFAHVLGAVLIGGGAQGEKKGDVMKLLTVLKSILVLLLTFSAIGCASFPGKNIPQYAYNDLTHPAEKINLRYDESLLKSKDLVSEEVVKIFRESNLFSEVTNEGVPEDFQIMLGFRNVTSPVDYAVGLVTWFLSGATFTVFPGYEKNEFMLTAEVKNGEIIKKYEYTEHIDEWFHPSMIFLLPAKSRERGLRQIVGKMCMNFLYDYSRDLNSGVYKFAHSEKLSN